MNSVSHFSAERFNFVTSVLTENALIQHWSSVLSKVRHQVIRYLENSESQSYAQAIYPLYIHLFGLIIAFLIFILERNFVPK